MSTGFLNSKILFVQIGGCGNRLGCSYWSYLSSEHSIDLRTGEYFGSDPHTELSLASSAFYELNANSEQCVRYRPAAVCVDVHSSGDMCEALAENGLDSILSDQTVVLGNSSMGCVDSFSIDQVLERIRFEIERDDQVGGFQLVHSGAGHFGSQCTKSLVESLRAIYAKKVLLSSCVLPTIDLDRSNHSKTRDLLSSIADHCDGCFVYDNKALERIWTRTLGFGNADLNSLNQLAAIHLGGITAAHRLPGQFNRTLHTLVRNITLLPKMNFFVPAIAPVYNWQSRSYAKEDVLELTRHLFDPSAAMISISRSRLVHYAMAAVYRGEASPWEINEATHDFMSKRSYVFRSNGFVYENGFVQTTHYPKSAGMSASALLSSNSLARLFEGNSGEDDDKMTQLAQLYTDF